MSIEAAGLIIAVQFAMITILFLVVLYLTYGAKTMMTQDVFHKTVDAVIAAMGAVTEQTTTTKDDEALANIEDLLVKLGLHSKVVPKPGGLPDGDVS